MHLGCGDMSGTITSLTPVLHFSDIRGWLEPRLCLRVDRFFDHLLPAVKFLASLLHLGLDRGFEAFSKGSN